jgi:hypothetical protein
MNYLLYNHNFSAILLFCCYMLCRLVDSDLGSTVGLLLGNDDSAGELMPDQGSVC